MFRQTLIPFAFLAFLCVVVDNVYSADEKPVPANGKAIYLRQCASCHGKAGEGIADNYDEPLTGELSVTELSKLIAETMPEDDPEACVGPQANAVAAYIHKSFYSQQAQAPRIKLARLTGDQLRQSLADLYAHFVGTPKWNARYGLRGEYYDGSRMRRDKRKIERVDPVLEFDFEDKSPGEGIDAKDFSIQWNGGLKVDVTGRYELVVRSSCSFVFYLGAYGREFINNHVQSGDKTEFRRSIVLTGGRVYPLKIRFQQRKRKTKQPPARISLSWVPPHGTERVIPKRNLFAENAPPTFALQTKLPPDDRSYGYERGIAVDRQWDDSTTAAAIEFAQIAADELWPRFQQQNKQLSNENRNRLKQFLLEVCRTAFRGPIDEEIRSLYVDAPAAASEDDAAAIKRALLIMLKSPRFLYPLLDHDRSPSQRAANRLALTLYDSLPADRWLIEQAAAGQLETTDEIRAAARRMVSDDRLRAKTRQMLYAWLNLHEAADINKNAEHFPDFDAELVSDLRGSLDRYLDEAVWSESSDYRKLVRADWTFTNERLHKYYGDAWKPADDKAGLTRSVADATQHAGLVSHPYLMSSLAYPDSTSPIHRGVFIIRYLLGRTLRPPQEAFTPLSPDLHPKLTTRERIALQTSPKSCQVCHTKINALGFTLEHFDAVGRYRVKEKDREIVTTGGYTNRIGKQTKIDGAGELSEYLATSDDAHRAFVERAFEHFVKQPPAAFGNGTLDQLTASFRKDEYSIRNLLIEIAVVAAESARD